MELTTIIILIIVGYVLLKIFSGSSKSKNKKQAKQYRTPQMTPQRPPAQTNNIEQNAKRQVSLGNFDEASNLYLRAGRIYQAAKTKAMKGPSAAPEVIEIISVNYKGNKETPLNNLVDEFYHRLNKPEVSIALLRLMNQNDRANAIQAVAFPQAESQSSYSPQEELIEVNQSFQTSSESIAETKPSVDMKNNLDDNMDVISEYELDDFLNSVEPVTEPAETKPVKNESPKTTKSIPNTLMMASGDLGENCIACRKAIKSGDSFIYCLNCGKAGHYKHLGEMIKVTGKCPSCGKRLVLSMFDLE